MSVSSVSSSPQLLMPSFIQPYKSTASLPQVPTPNTQSHQGLTSNQALPTICRLNLCLAILPPCSVVTLFLFFTTFSEMLYNLSAQPSPNFYRSFSCSWPGKLSRKQKTGKGASALLLGSRAWMGAPPASGYVRARVLSASSAFLAQSGLS